SELGKSDGCCVNGACCTGATAGTAAIAVVGLSAPFAEISLTATRSADLEPWPVWESALSRGATFSNSGFAKTTNNATAAANPATITARPIIAMRPSSCRSGGCGTGSGHKSGLALRTQRASGDDGAIDDEMI